MTLRLLHLPAAASPWVRLARRPREPHPSQVERGLLSPCSTPGVWEAAILGRLGQLPTSQATMREGLGLRDRPDGCLEPCSSGSPPCLGGEGGGVQFPLKSATFAHIRSHPGVRPSYHRQMAVFPELRLKATWTSAEPHLPLPPWDGSMLPEKPP